MAREVDRDSYRSARTRIGSLEVDSEIESLARVCKQRQRLRNCVRVRVSCLVFVTLAHYSKNSRSSATEDARRIGIYGVTAKSEDS